LIVDELGPVLVAPSEDVFDEWDGLVGFSYDREDTVASSYFVVLYGQGKGRSVYASVQHTENLR